MSKQNFFVLYDGNALVDNEMSVATLAPALLALGRVLEIANETLNGNRATVGVNVKASFKTGCFGIELSTYQTISELTKNLFHSENIATAKNILEWLGLIGSVGGSLFALIAWVKKRKIDKVEILDNGKCRFTVGDDFFDTEKEVLKLYQSLKLHEQIYKVVEPLLQDGIEEFAVVDKKQKRFFAIKKQLLPAFEPPCVPDEVLQDTPIEMMLQVVSLSFQGDYKWRFLDGNSTILATVADEDFIQQVQNNAVAFSNGDIIHAVVRLVQYLSDGKVKNEYTVEKVLRHHHAGQQVPLPL